MMHRFRDFVTRVKFVFYTAAACERDMRRLNNGERGCQAPSEHRFRGRLP